MKKNTIIINKNIGHGNMFKSIPKKVKIPPQKYCDNLV
jgi:hypothetical protein